MPLPFEKVNAKKGERLRDLLLLESPPLAYGLSLDQMKIVQRLIDAAHPDGVSHQDCVAAMRLASVKDADTARLLNLVVEVCPEGTLIGPFVDI